MDTDDRPLPQGNIDMALEQEHNEVYKTKKGATADYFSSCGWLNDYCNALPHDMFTEPVCEWKEQSVDGQIIVSIFLPIQSPLTNEIIVS